jgi:hypothetical protein
MPTKYHDRPINFYKDIFWSPCTPRLTVPISLNFSLNNALLIFYTIAYVFARFLSLRTLKGQCHEIFDPRFFSSNNPP